MQNGIIIGAQKEPTPDYTLHYEKQEFEGNTYYVVSAIKPPRPGAIQEEPQLVAHFFEEQAAKMCCVRYNLHEALMKICLLASNYRARERVYINQRNIGANAAKKEAGDMLDRAIVDVQKL
jgi:hypothetical protein